MNAKIKTEAKAEEEIVPLHTFKKRDKVVMAHAWDGCPVPNGAEGRVLKAGERHIDVRFDRHDLIVFCTRLFTPEKASKVKFA